MVTTTPVKPLLNLDGTNITWHADRVEAWERGERIAPVSVDLALQKACNASCRGCIHEDEPVRMADGSTKPIRDIRAGDYVAAMNGKGQIVGALVTKAWETSPDASIVRIIMEHGIIRCTPDHPIFTPFGWCEAGGLKPGDEIACWPYQRQSIRSGAEGFIREDEALQRDASGLRGDPAEARRVNPQEQCREAIRRPRKTAAQRIGEEAECRSRGTQASVGAHEATSRGRQNTAHGSRATVLSLPPQSGTEAPISTDSRGQTQAVGENARRQSNEDARSRGACSCPGPAEAVSGRVRGGLSRAATWTEQGRSEGRATCLSTGIPIRWRWPLLDRTVPEREAPESRLHLREWIESNRPAVPLEFLAHASAPGGAIGGIAGLRSRGVEGVRRVGDDDGAPQANCEGNPRLVGWSAVRAVEPAGRASVYDLTVERHHNFIAADTVVHNCYAVLQESQERSQITEKHALDLLDDFKRIGVRAVSIVSDGESTLSKAYVPFILHAAELGIDVGNATNGWRLFPEVSEQILPHMKWIRFTVLSGRPDRFADMMIGDPKRTDLFWTAMHNISEAVQIRKRQNLGVTLGIQTFLTPNDRDEILDFARLGIALGVQYVVLKHFSDDETGSYGVKYDDYPRIYDALREAEAMSTAETQIIVKWSKLKDGNQPPYKRLWGAPFLLQISGSGLIAPSGMFFQARHSKLHIGDFTQERFIDIWRSERYWQAMGYLASPAFDAAMHAGALPIQHYASVALDRHVKGIERIMTPPEGTPRPVHYNFV